MTPEPAPKPRRFYKAVSVRAGDGGFGVRLDGRAARTPAGKPLAAPTAALAAALAAEWDRQDGTIDFAVMPLTRLAFTTCDRTPGHRDGLAEEVARYAASDLLCYRDEPGVLADRESELWAPWLDWAARDLQVRLECVAGVAPVAQPPEAVDRVKDLCRSLGDFPLTGLAFAAGLYGSAVLAFAVERGELSALGAFELSRLDEAFQEERWGVDAEAGARTDRLRGEAAALGLWFAALVEP